jgi:Ribosomal protein L15
MPLQRRLPKFGFTSRKSLVRDEIRLAELNKVEGDEITMDSLRAARLIGENTLHVKIILAGEIQRAVTVKGLKITKGAQAAIEAAGGKVEA